MYSGERLSSSLPLAAEGFGKGENCLWLPHYPEFICIFLSIRHYVTSQTTLWEASFLVSGRHFLSLPQIPSCCLSPLPWTYLG